MKLDRVHASLALLLALGVGWRALHQRHGPSATDGASLVNSQLERVDSARARSAHRAKGRRKSEVPRVTKSKLNQRDSSATREETTPVGAMTLSALRPPSPIQPATGEAELLVDVEAASALEIERLPGIGPALAKRIVEDRARNGPFRSLSGLDRVKGVGPALLREMARHVTFGRAGRPSSVPVVEPAPPPGRRPARGRSADNAGR